MEMSRMMMGHAMSDDALNDVSGGVYMWDVAIRSVDPNLGCCDKYRCKVCGGGRGAHTPGCTAGRPDCCGSCVHASNSSGDWVCDGVKVDK